MTTVTQGEKQGRAARRVKAWPGLSSHPQVTVVIPTKDEEGLIGEIIDAVRPFAAEILVVDGHSTDRTRELAAIAGARVILDARRGKGEALRRSFEQARHEVLVFVDADGSHDPKDIPALVEPIVRGEAELVIASRTRGGSDELHGTAEQLLRYIGSQLILLAFNYRWQFRLTDSQNGFRAIRRDVVRALPPDLRPHDHRAGDVDARTEVRLSRRRGSESRVRAALGRVESQRVAVMVGVSLVGGAEHLLNARRAAGACDVR